MKQLIINADDFGLCPEVNVAVIKAYREGVLTSASLMVAAPAAAEAAEAARRNPGLKIGLHLVLVEGHSVLPKSVIPDLVDERGCFSSRLVRSGFRYYFSRKLKKQIQRECEAQIKLFLSTGLKMDHLNGHNHFHIHPTVAGIIVRLCEQYHIPAVRLPWQGWRKGGWVTAPWVKGLKKKLKKRGILSNCGLFGLHETGRLDIRAWGNIIPSVQKGLTEIYCHPAVKKCDILNETMSDYKHPEELAALVDPKVKSMLENAGIQRTTFSEAAGV